MMKRSDGRSRWRWMLALLFVLCATVSMIGPTQALSGLVNAPVTVVESITQAFGNETPPKPARSVALNFNQPFDEAVTPDFGELISTLPPEAAAREGDPTIVAETTPATTAAPHREAQSPHSDGLPGTGGSGDYGASGSRPGFSLPGLGGAPSGSFAGMAPEDFVATDLALESARASLIAGALQDDINSPEFASAYPLPLALGPAAGSGPGAMSLSPPGNAEESGGGSDTPQSPLLPLLSPVHSVSPSPASGAPLSSDNNPVPPVVIADLLNDLGFADSVAAHRDLASQLSGASGTEEGIGVFQIPEPSMFALAAVGGAAVVRNRGRRRSSATRV